MDFADETLMAYADGELDPLDAARIEAAMARDPALAARVARFRAVRRALRAAYDRVVQEPVPDRLRALLGDVATVEPIEIRPPAKARPAGGRFAAPMIWVALAITLCVGILIGSALG